MAYEVQRKRAANIPIDGRYPELGHAIRDLLGWTHESDRTYYSSRAASRLTGVNYVSIGNASRGDRPSVDSLKKLAQGLNGDTNHLLRLAYQDDPIALALSGTNQNNQDSLIGDTFISQRQSIGILIRRRREQLKITQAEMASELKMSKANYSRYESGVTNISVVDLLYVAKKLRTTISDLTGSGEATASRFGDAISIIERIANELGYKLVKIDE